MSAATMICESTQPAPFAWRSGINRIKTAGCSAEKLDLPLAPSDTVQAQLLLVQDNPAGLAELLRQTFPAPRYRLCVVRSGKDGLRLVSALAPDVIVLDLEISQPSGLELCQEIRRIDARIPIICVASPKRSAQAIEAVKEGAYAVLFKPVAAPELLRTVEEALDVAKRMQAPPVFADVLDSETEDGIIGVCPAMQEVYKSIGRVAAQTIPVLITGESGTGKELVARAIHLHSERADGPFLALNCAAIPENLLESELFGHEKGAFTGAHGKRIGKFEQCHGGTLFLDEIGDMPLGAQSKILRVVQEKSFERVGGNESIRTDVRLLAATHRDLTAWSAAGKFRPDLYYRLGVFTIRLPPLRERGDDLPALARHYLQRFSRELGRDVQGFAPEALKRMRSHSWPGNVRELQSILKQALLRARGTVLLPDFLPEFLEGAAEPAPAVAPGDARGLESFIRSQLGHDASDIYADVHREVDRLLLPRVLDFTRGNQHRAASLLGIARQTLRMKLREQKLISSCPA
jgi:DNA-binding NtrC family response regulator